MSYTLKSEYYNPGYSGYSDASYPLAINVMKVPGVDSSYLDTTYDYIGTALNELYSNQDIQATAVRKYTTDANLSCDSLIPDANNWLDANGFNDELYLWVVGCDGTSFAQSHENGWEKRRVAFTKTKSGAESAHNVGVTGIMEGLHPYIYNKSCNTVINLAGGEEDHKLGMVWSDHYASPMLGWYGESVATSGQCNDWYDTGGISRDMTSCTMNAVEDSWKHVAGKYH